MVTCWDGECADSMYDCRPIPFCNSGQKRCSDGSCRAESDSTCTANVPCGVNLTLCADGTCQTTCPPYFGCLPNDMPVMCADGSCSSTWEDCNIQCNATYLACFAGCGASCNLPDFMMPADIQPLTVWSLTSNVMKTADVNFVLGGSKNSNLRGLLQSTAPRTLPSGMYDLQFSWNFVDYAELMSIGPLPTWGSEFKFQYITSAVIHLYLPNAADLYSLGGNVTYIINHLPLDGELVQSISTQFCMASSVPWYWHPNDALATSLLANVSYIAQFRNLVQSYSTTNYSSIPGLNNIKTPATRWQCMSAKEYQWPQFVISADPTYAQWFGVIIPENLDSAVAILSEYPDGGAPLPPPAPIAPMGLPKDPVACYAVLGVASTILFVLIIVVLSKALQKK